MSDTDLLLTAEAVAAAERAQRELNVLIDKLDALDAPTMSEDAVTAETLTWQILGTLRDELAVTIPEYAERFAAQAQGEGAQG